MTHWCSVKDHLTAVGLEPPADMRSIFQTRAPNLRVDGAYSLRELLTFPFAPVIDAPTGANVSPKGVVIRWHDPGAGLCNAATRFSVSLDPDQGQTIPALAPPAGSYAIPYVLFYQRQYKISVEGDNAGGAQAAQGSFFTADQPAPIDLSPHNDASGVSQNPTLSWEDPGVVPATEFLVTIRDPSAQRTESAKVSGSSYAVPFQLAFLTKYEWTVAARYPGNSFFGLAASATFVTVAAPPSGSG